MPDPENVSPFIVTPPPISGMPVLGTHQRFPVRRIYCVGRNYADHAIEMGHDPNREPPFFFQKNPDNIITDGTFPYPVASNDVHHEVEMVVALKSGGANIAVEDALDHVFGYCIGLDMTRRDLQAEAKKLGRPWEIGKAFEHSAPCSAIIPAAKAGHPSSGRIALTVNGVEVQSGDLDQMIWKVPETISYLSNLFTLAPGDVIMTGTPAGVGPVKRGDILHATIDGLGALDVEVV